MDHPKPRIIISACLEFVHCRYDGKVIYNKFIRKIIPYVEFIKICPEEAIGLGTPRRPIRLVRINDKTHLYQPSSEKDLTEDMQKFSQSFLGRQKDIDGAILKYQSPSCGPSNTKIYNDLDPKKGVRKGKGMFAENLMNAFPNIAIQDEGRLNSTQLREHFLTKLFTLTRLRNINTHKELMTFQANHKYLLMSFNQSIMRKLGKLIADASQENFDEIKLTYQEELCKAMHAPQKYTNAINVLEHIFGGFSSKLTKEEKEHYKDLIEEYRDERIPLSAIANLLYSWAIRFNITYLKDQYLFEPYPKELGGEIN